MEEEGETGQPSQIHGAKPTPPLIRAWQMRRMPVQPRITHLRVISFQAEGAKAQWGRGRHPDGAAGLQRGERGQGEGDVREGSSVACPFGVQ